MVWGESVNLAELAKNNQLDCPCSQSRSGTTMYLTGTGIDFDLGSAATRVIAMHAKSEETWRIRMKIFSKMGVEGASLKDGQKGVCSQNWFLIKAMALVWSQAGRCFTFAIFCFRWRWRARNRWLLLGGRRRQSTSVLVLHLGENEFSDHITERQNYLYLSAFEIAPSVVWPWTAGGWTTNAILMVITPLNVVRKPCGKKAFFIRWRQYVTHLQKT